MDITEHKGNETPVTLTQGANDITNVTETSTISIAQKLIKIAPSSWIESPTENDVSYGLLVQNLVDNDLGLLLNHDANGEALSVNYQKVVSSLLPYLEKMDYRLSKLEGNN